MDRPDSTSNGRGYDAFMLSQSGDGRDELLFAGMGKTGSVKDSYSTIIYVWMGMNMSRLYPAYYAVHNYALHECTLQAVYPSLSRVGNGTSVPLCIENSTSM